MTSRILLLLLIASLKMFSQNPNNDKTPQLTLSTIKQVIAAMTLEEKVSLVVGSNPKSGENEGPIIGNAKGRVAGAAGYTSAISRMGIPITVLADGPAGVRIWPTRETNPGKTYFATAWPVGTLLASSWDTALVKKVGVAFGNEVKEYGVDIILAPGVNIQRDPLNGRNFEYYSEDPFLTGFISSSIIQGIQSNGVGVSIKHFAANNQESNRNNVDAIVSERALREIYLRGFEIAIKNANPWTVMSSYNKLNGIYTSQNHDLLTTILREEWGFQGYVMSDWFSGDDAAKQLIAGNDLIEPGGYRIKRKIVEAYENGTLNKEALDKNVERILNIILKTPSFLKHKYSETPDLKRHAVIAREAASESMILLKNGNNTLPLNKAAKIALFGVASYDTNIGGDGSGDVNEAYSISIFDGLKNAGYIPCDKLIGKYKTYIEEDRIVHPKKELLTLGKPVLTPEYVPDFNMIEESANAADIAIITIGRKSGEGGDRNVTDDFNLSSAEEMLLKNVSDVFHARGKKLIVLINSGGVIETASWKNYADAILLPWQPGQEAGNAIADVLKGKVNPSGKLATTFPLKYEDLPSSKNFPGTPVEKPTEVRYEEGIYVGYRYFNSFGVKTSYPFGYGLSYTTFNYSNLKLSSSIFKDKMTATITITNTGKVEGKEVVQLYLSAPTSSLDKPAQELKGFAKTALLKPGASQTITFTLNAKDLSSFSTTDSAWVADAGKYMVKIGASSEDIKLTKSFTVSKEILVEKVNKALVPQVQINEIKMAPVEKPVRY